MKVRHRFLDVYRGIIVLLMIEGHVVRELLAAAHQNSGVFRAHELLHGITGPGFLFGAGITFGLSAQSRWGDFLTVSPALARRIRKIFLLLGIGYALHLPFFSLSKMLAEATPADWRAFWNFDVLQCIGFSLLILQATVMVIRRERWFVIAIVALMLTAMYSAPPLWAHTDSLPAFLSYALTGTEGSIYPLVPYSAFLFAGALVSYEFLRFAKAGREAAFVQRLAGAGGAAIILGIALDALPFHTYPAYDYWLTSPNFLLIKLGGICLLMSAAWMFHRAFEAENSSPILRWVVVVGVESLFVYVVHLIVLYGSVLNPELGIRELLTNTGWVEALAAAAVFTGLMIGLARFWNFLRTEHPVLKTGLSWWMGIMFTLEFITRQY